jgi:hypothetical protein
MKRVTGLIALAMALMFVTGCGYKSGVSTGEQEAFLYFTGKVKGATVSVDGGEPFAVKAGRDNQYKIKPGKHSVKVYSGGKVVVDREIYVGDGVAKEIGVAQ